MKTFQKLSEAGIFATKLTALSASASTDVFLTDECEISIIQRHINPGFAINHYFDISLMGIGQRYSNCGPCHFHLNKQAVAIEGQIVGLAKGPIYQVKTNAHSLLASIVKSIGIFKVILINRTGCVGQFINQTKERSRKCISTLASD